MPLPAPKKGQTEDEFVSQCLANPIVQRDFKTQQQRLAVCFSQYKKAKQKAKGAEVNFEDQLIDGNLLIL